MVRRLEGRYDQLCEEMVGSGMLSGSAPSFVRILFQRSLDPDDVAAN